MCWCPETGVTSSMSVRVLAVKGPRKIWGLEEGLLIFFFGSNLQGVSRHNAQLSVLRQQIASRQFPNARLPLVSIAQKSISRTVRAPASERGASPLGGGSDHAQLATKAFPICIVHYCGRGSFVFQSPDPLFLFLEHIVRSLRLPPFSWAIIPPTLPVLHLPFSLSLFRRILSNPTVKVSNTSFSLSLLSSLQEDT